MAVGVGVVAACLLIWTFRSLGTNLTDTVVTRKDHTLVTSGPYRFVRHPFYVAYTLAIAAKRASNGELVHGAHRWARGCGCSSYAPPRKKRN